MRSTVLINGSKRFMNMLKQLQFSYAPDFDAFEIFQNELDAARERLLNITRRLRLENRGETAVWQYFGNI